MHVRPISKFTNSNFTSEHSCPGSEWLPGRRSKPQWKKSILSKRKRDEEESWPPPDSSAAPADEDPKVEPEPPPPTSPSPSSSTTRKGHTLEEHHSFSIR